jgi:hypothetical protein
METLQAPREKETEAAAAELLPLDAPERVAVFRMKGKSYRHIFRRITPRDWENFFSLIVAEFKQEPGGFTQVVDTDCASLALYGKIIQRVEGYTVKDGSAVESLPMWQERIPQNHRLIAMDLLMRAGASDAADDSALDVEGVTVSLDALWSPVRTTNRDPGGPILIGPMPGNEGPPHDQMTLYRGLLHKFAQPTAEHRRRFLKAKNRAFVAGGSRSGITRIPSAHPLLVKLYDELIESVEGYSVGGAALASREQAMREMDAFHKATAVGALFPTMQRPDDEKEEAKTE